jgi:hypothetical protein
VPHDEFEKAGTDFDRAPKLILDAITAQPEIRGMDPLVVGHGLCYVALNVVAAAYGHDAARKMFKHLLTAVDTDEQEHRPS